MLENLMLGFLEVFTLANLAGMFFGVFVGVVLGAIPGLSATMGIAIILPMTYGMNPIMAISMLLAAYKGGTFGGSMPAIYLNTPGTAAAVATVLDGYPMAKKGQAGLAMKMTLYSSVIADVFGTLSLIFLSAILINFALRFGAPEFATLILFSLTLVASLSAESMIKGLIAGSIGVLMATIGLDSMSGVHRFIFGESYLMGGLDLMVVMIGLFAVSEVFIQAIGDTGSGEAIATEEDPASAKVTWKQFRKYIKTIIRGSLIGVFIGAIPGLGATPAAFLSYSEARRNSKNPQDYGKGEVDGVVAAESANNATVGSVLIPTLALGIPGNVTSAILLGGLILHGLVPGPALFTDNPVTIYAIMVGLLFSGLFLLIIGSQFIRFFVKITLVPKSIVFPIVFVFCIVGAYAMNRNIIDVYLMGIMGVLGYFLRKYEFPLAPLLITFILTPMLESNVRRSLTISRGSFMIFLERPISLLFVILSVVGIILAKRLQNSLKTVSSSTVDMKQSADSD